jgi:predicted transcriptional regulator
MARNRSADVETPAEETEQVDTPEASAEGTEPKGKKEPARGQLPDGYVTPIGLAKVLTERGLHQNRQGETVEVRPQMVYSYIKNAPKDDKFPSETITDSIGKERNAVQLEAGVQWWERKNARVAARKENAAKKAAAKEQRAAQKAQEATEAEGSEEQGEATEAE